MNASSSDKISPPISDKIPPFSKIPYEEDLAFQVKALTRLHELSMELAGSIDLNASLHSILETIVELHKANQGLISLYDPISGCLYDAASVGLQDDTLHQFSRLSPESNSSACSTAFMTKKRAVIEDTEKEDYFSYREVAQRAGFRSVHSTPILTRSGEILGVLSVHFSSPRKPNDREMKFSDMCARHAADAIEASKSQQALLESEQRLRKINNELEERVKERTNELEKQSNRLRNLADQLAATEQRERKRIAAILHDHLQQILVASTFQIAEASRKIKERHFEKANENLSRCSDFLTEAINASRSLSVELRPPVLYEDGFVEAFKWLARKFADEHNLKISLDLEDVQITLSDSLKIMIFESVKELLFNVVKHSKVQYAKLSFKLIDPNILYFCVEDPGIGFDVIHQEKIFSENERGIGLFSIRERLKLLRAEFDIISRVGHGTRIEIKIPMPPIAPSEENTKTENLSPQASPNTNKAGNKIITILLADDHKLVREGIANILKMNPLFHVVAHAENGLQAREKAAAFLPDVIIMDINMPHMNGIEATRLIKRDFPQIQIIGLSVQDEYEIAFAMKKAGALTLLNKAGDAEELIQTILDCVKH